MTQQDCNGAYGNDVGARSVTAGETAPAHRAITAPWVSAPPETTAAEVKPLSVADPSQLLGKGRMWLWSRAVMVALGGRAPAGGQWIRGAELQTRDKRAEI